MTPGFSAVKIGSDGGTMRGYIRNTDLFTNPLKISLLYIGLQIKKHSRLVPNKYGGVLPLCDDSPYRILTPFSGISNRGWLRIQTNHHYLPR